MFFLDRINGIVRIRTIHINPITRFNADKKKTTRHTANLQGRERQEGRASVRKVESPKTWDCFSKRKKWGKPLTWGTRTRMEDMC